MQFDYLFMGMAAETDIRTYLSVVIVNTGYGFTTEVRKKGPSDSFAVKATLRFLEEAGLNSDAIFQGDAEAALQDFMRAVAQARGGKTILRRAPVGSHQSVGSVERFHRSVQGLARALKAKLVMNFKSDPPEYVMPWLVLHASWLVTRFQTRSTGATAFHAQRGMPYRSTLYEFGESVLAKVGEDKQPAKVEERWITGTWWVDPHHRMSTSLRRLTASSCVVQCVRGTWRSSSIRASTRPGKVCHGIW